MGNEKNSSEHRTNDLNAFVDELSSQGIKLGQLTESSGVIR